MMYSYPGHFAILNPKNDENDINLGSDLDENFTKLWLNAFHIKVQSLK